MEQTKILIEGMDCNNCAESISAMLRKKGIKDAHVNFATGEAFFTPVNGFTVDDAISSILSMGYRVLDEKNPELPSFFTLEKKLLFCVFFTVPLLLHMLPGFDFLDRPALQLILSLPVVLVGFFHFGRSAWSSLKNLFPNMDVLIFTGFTSAFFYSVIGTFFTPANEQQHHYFFYETAASIITLVLLGNYIEHKSVKKAASSVELLNTIKPATARIVVRVGEKEKYILTEIRNVKKGDVLQVNTGERIPADGVISEGTGYADQSMFTGESEMIFLDIGKKVIGGSVLTDGNVKVVADSVGEDSYLNKMIEMVKKASFKKPSIQQLGDRVSAIFVPVVLLISLVTFLLARFVFGLDNFHAVMNAIAVLVISCPCAMGLATPTAVMVGIGRSARQGIIIKGGNILQQLAEAKNFLFDKTGTLTDGNFRILKIEIHDNSFSEEKVRGLLYAMESKSSHPLGRAICAELEMFAGETVHESKETKGVGIKARVGEVWYELGSARILPKDFSHDGGQIFLKSENRVIASVFLQDHLRLGAAALMQYLQHEGIHTAVLSGDTSDKCRTLSEKTGLKNYYSDLLPHEKLTKIHEYNERGMAVMVGDGINDAPSLSAAAVGISYSTATDIAVQSADVILLEGSLEKIREARELAKATLLTIKQNLFWAFCYNAVAIPLAACGFLNPMWGAAFMAFSDLMVIGNSVRLNYKNIPH